MEWPRHHVFIGPKRFVRALHGSGRDPMASRRTSSRVGAVSWYLEVFLSNAAMLFDLFTSITFKTTSYYFFAMHVCFSDHDVVNGGGYCQTTMTYTPLQKHFQCKPDSFRS